MTQITTPKTYNKKKKLVQLIHIGKSQLHLDDDTYRDILAYTTGKTSTKEMNFFELDAVLNELKRKGFILIAPKSSGKIKQANDPQAKLIRHLWLSLHNLGAVRDPSEKALCSYIKRQTGIDALNWLPTDKASRVIESLKKWIERVEKQAEKTENIATPSP